ncbi:uncharacterized protein [Aegilops tauschii subsp. strangulata]|uniref:uncharacterized protein isoform X4 n=1 Tax=Aegilops tauschii subsp. strangulata TaxID=200361 RepID=UPI00098B400D|nr:uncharacterized protein LOC109754533 isoform X4 [Aegilops tauschii subsp. strangulata]
MPPPPRNDGSRDSDTSPAFHLPQLVFSPVDLEEPPFARHRGRAAATTRGLPLAGAPSFSTTRHQQRRMTPPSTPSHDVQPLTPPETLARIGQRQLKEGAGHGEATRAASSVHTHHRSSEGASLLGLANYADEEEDEHRGPRGRANGRPREEEEEEDERRALERRPRQVELRRDCPYLDTVNRLRPLDKRQFGVFRDCMYGGIEGVPLLTNCRRLPKLQLIGRLTTWLSKQQNQFSGVLGSTSLLIGQIMNLDSAILVQIPLIWYDASTLMHQLCSINMDTYCLLVVFFDSFVLPLLPVTRFQT